MPCPRGRAGPVGRGNCVTRTVFEWAQPKRAVADGCRVLPFSDGCGKAASLGDAPPSSLRQHPHASPVKADPRSLLPAVVLPARLAVLTFRVWFSSLCPARPGRGSPWHCDGSIAVCCLLCEGNSSTLYQPMVRGLLLSSSEVSVIAHWQFRWKTTVEGLFIIAFEDERNGVSVACLSEPETSWHGN